MIAHPRCFLKRRMLPIELPRALEHYFAFAETEPTRRGRRFAITLPYYRSGNLDRIQWWYHVSPAEELQFDGEALTVYRARATEKFRRHIEQWLVNTGQRLHGDSAIPSVSPLNETQPAAVEAPVEMSIEAIVSEDLPEEALMREPTVVNG
jgi:hypothetical protein